MSSYNRFSMIPSAQIERSTFDRSFRRLMTFNDGDLTPCYFEEVYPGDTFNCEVNFVCRLASPLKTPIMDNIDIDFHFFFVPWRLVWDHWKEFMGENDTSAGIQTTDYLVPVTSSPSGADSSRLGSFTGDIFSCFALPPLSAVTRFNTPADAAEICGSISALPFRAYSLIWNEWFRDENLQNPVLIYKGDSSTTFSWKLSECAPGSGSVSSASPLYGYCLPRAKKHDYFTSAQPWPQKGPGVELPLGETAAVLGTGDALGLYAANKGGSSGDYSMGVLEDNGQATLRMFQNAGQDVGASGASASFTGGVTVGVVQDATKSGLVADLTSATAVTINSLRQAFQLQKFYERDARGGTRYTEIVRSHFGVVSPDARLQRPEFLGGFSQPIMVNQVVQNSASVSEQALGDLAAYAVSSASRHGFTRSFTEHGCIIGLVSTRADLTYQTGINRCWSRRSRTDFYFPVFAHLGEQAILNKEIASWYGAEEGGPAPLANLDGVFGYQERWAELRYHPNEVSNDMLSGVDASFDVWHLAQDFGKVMPRLNSDFISERAPLARVKAVQTAPDFLLDIFYKQKVARPLPVYSVPGLVDHF